MLIYRVEKFNHDGPFIPTTGDRAERNAFYDALPSAAPWLKVEVVPVEDFFSSIFYDTPMGETFRRANPDDDHPHHTMDIPRAALHPLEVEADYRLTKLRTGVDSMDMLHHWFNPTDEAKAFFAKYGHELSIYECEERWVAKGKYQLVFICEEATLVERKPFE